MTTVFCLVERIINIDLSSIISGFDSMNRQPKGKICLKTAG